MPDAELDEVAQLRLLGIGLAVGGLLFGLLTVAGSVFAAGGAVIGLGVVVWYEEYRRRSTVGVGPGLFVVGLLAVLEAALSTGYDPLEIAAFAVVVGVLDYLLAPAFGRIRDAGENARGR